MVKAPHLIPCLVHSSLTESSSSKKSGGYEKAPVTLDPTLKAVHKAKHLQEIMKFIKEHPLPSQKKRKVVGKKGEEERLLTVLWYDQQSKAARKLTGDLDDSD
jgi:hypothetical protein